MSAADPQDHRLDHIVVLMFENHSFDSLLGYLYQPGEVPAFEGVLGRTLTNPVPPSLGPAPPVPVHPADSMATPFPDPGEEYPHVNTQLFGTVAPESNRFAEVDDMAAPFNAPASSRSPPPMNGFVEDFVGAFHVQMGRLPRPDEYAQIMACYTPSQAPVLSGLARGFACYDHWFCEAPTQTYPNRSFFHAATSSGFVLNGRPMGKFATQNDALTIFDRLESAGRTWRVYYDPAQLLSATALIHARRLAPYFATRFGTIYDFYEDVAHGELPNYAFLEPNMFHPHTDMHPHASARWAADLGLPPPDTLIGGEQLLARVYQAIRDSTAGTGSNWSNTALLVTFDEHGGTYDHVPPPRSVPPDAAEPEMGFPFDRLGVRVPSILVSAWVDERTVVTDPYQGTSLIRTLRDWWDLGNPLTARDATAPSLLPALTRPKPREPEAWPVITPREPGILTQVEQKVLRLVEELNAPMEQLERHLLGAALAHEARLAGSKPPEKPGAISHRDAHDHFTRIASKLFAAITNGRTR